MSSGPHKKPLSQIQVYVKTQSALGALPAAELSLDELLERYVLLLGPDSATIKGIVTQLLTEGKVYADFQTRTDRLELADYGDCVKLAQAVAIFEDFLSSRGQLDATAPSRANMTQRIILRAPKQ